MDSAFRLVSPFACLSQKLSRFASAKCCRRGPRSVLRHHQIKPERTSIIESTHMLGHVLAKRTILRFGQIKTTSHSGVATSSSCQGSFLGEVPECPRFLEETNGIGGTAHPSAQVRAMAVVCKSSLPLTPLQNVYLLADFPMDNSLFSKQVKSPKTNRVAIKHIQGQLTCVIMLVFEPCESF